MAEITTILDLMRGRKWVRLHNPATLTTCDAHRLLRQQRRTRKGRLAGALEVGDGDRDRI